MTMKTKWKVQPAPTGRYRSFEKRGWPQLFYEDGQLAAGIECDDDYTISRARFGESAHAPLSVLIYDHSLGTQKRKVRRLIERFSQIDKAKAAAEVMLKTFPHFVASKRKEPT